MLVLIQGNKTKLLAEQDNKRAQLLAKLIKEPTRLLSTIQVGITFAGFFPGASAATGVSDNLATNPTDAVEKPKKLKEEMPVLDSLQVKKLLNRLKSTTLYVPVLLVLTIGARRSEICAFKWSKIDFDSKKKHVN